MMNSSARLLTGGCSEDPLGLWPFSPTRLQGPHTPKEEDVQAAAISVTASIVADPLDAATSSALRTHAHLAAVCQLAELQLIRGQQPVVAFVGRI